MEIRFIIFNLLMNNTYLGDPYQQIYMFRGAVNALGKEYTEHIQSIFTQITGFLLNG